MKVEIQHDGRTNDNIEVFKNPFFGLISDSRNILFDVRSGVSHYVWIIQLMPEFGCRWRVSTEQETIEPYFSKPEMPKPILNLSQSENLTAVIGIVTSHAKIGNFWLVWSRSRENSTICLDFDHCPSNMSMLGKWAEMRVDKKHRVREPIRIIQDMFETRTTAGVTEIRVNFRHAKRFKSDLEIFYNDYFGDILDSYGILDHVEKGAWYNGWIVYKQNRETNTLWKLVTKQNVQGPFNNPPDSERNSQIPPNRCSNERNYEFRDDARLYTNRSPSPDIKNEYDDPPELNACSSSERSEQRRINTSTNNEVLPQPNDNNSYNDHRPTQHSNIQYDRERRRTRSPDRRTFMQSKHKHYSEANDYQSTTNRTDTYPVVNSNESDTKINRNQNENPYQTHSPIVNDLVRPHRSEMPNKSMDHQRKYNQSEYNDDHKESSSWESTTKRGLPIERIPIKNEEIHLEKKNHNPLPPKFDLQEVSKKADVTNAEAKEIRQLKLKLARISELVLSLTTDETVSIPMKLWSLEDYEDLMELVKSNVEKDS